MKQASRTRIVWGRGVCQLIALIPIAIALAGAVPAAAQDWHRREEWREHAWREHEWREREWREREWHERGVYLPYVVPPPAVVYTPPVQGPAINFVFPFTLR